ncbi:hypothetical protein [Rubritepida flocculans]|uniref:hypothetical protein n=1 Tax=Rubritepida flocculans TaxID=182403 RepID=UPI00040418D9|nr:hypothetical protein [Rubritepida flocculans]
MTMRLGIMLALLLAASPALAQRAPGPHDGIYDGVMFQECRGGGRVRQDRTSAEVRGGEIVIAGLPGDAPITGRIGANGAVTLPPVGLFQAGQGQIFIGANNARRFTGSHPGRGTCSLGYDLRRSGPLPRGR